jgi:hypothetical protein
MLRDGGPGLSLCSPLRRLRAATPDGVGLNTSTRCGTAAADQSV